jgi:5-methylcytosine-specific restriction enzyme A
MTDKLSGKVLNDLWQVGAKHALYRADGKWYHHLKDFPGALFDANGYVVFQTEKDYQESPYLQLQQDLHIPGGISAIPNYVRVTETAQLQAVSHQIKKIAERMSAYGVKNAKKRHLGFPNVPQASDPSHDPAVAKRVLMQSERIIRDTRLTLYVKYLHGYQCQICGESIELGNDRPYAEGHHIKPLGKNHNGPDVIENILCVCPNHHAQLDFQAILINKSSLRLQPGHEISDEYIEYHNRLARKNKR